MANTTPIRLFTPQEKLDIYGMPNLNDTERREYFTFNTQELKTLKRFRHTTDAIYFAISLVFFKLKKTLVEFSYRDVTQERRHVMARYFSNKKTPRLSYRDESSKRRVEKSVLEVCGYTRYQPSEYESLITNRLTAIAPNHPRQRQLCKALLDLFIELRIAIPAFRQINQLVTTAWQAEKQRIVKAYQRYTRKTDRNLILSLLDKNDNFYTVISIRKDMKGFNTRQLELEIKKHDILQPVFEIAQIILPKLKLPNMTIKYYAELVIYYDGYRLREINILDAQLYLLCYAFTRFQALNDNLLEAFKHRTQTFTVKMNHNAKDGMLRYLKTIKQSRKRVSDLLLAIHDHAQEFIPSSLIYSHIEKNDLPVVAKQIIDEQLDEDFLFWRQVDDQHGWIKTNLRKLFLTMDFTVSHDELLSEAVKFLKNKLSNHRHHEPQLTKMLADWIKPNVKEHIIIDGKLQVFRFEFYVYQEIIQSIKANKLYLKNSNKFKYIDDDLMPRKTWKKEKKKILGSLNYPKLMTPAQKIISEKRETLTTLYHTMQDALLNNKLDHIKLVNNNGILEWRLRSLEAETDDNERLLDKFQPRSIVDVMRFVQNKTLFTRVFESILPRGKKGELDIIYIMAVILANAIRIGAPKIAEISDLNISSLLTTEASYIREETIVAAINWINKMAAKLPIYKAWYIQGIKHASLDGLKLNVQIRNAMARGSSKYFPLGVGVSAYNAILNSFPIAED